MTPLLTALIEPLQQEFMVRALLVRTVVSCVCSLLSCSMTLKGWALMGDADYHALMPGVVIAYALNLTFAVGAFVFGVGSVALIGPIRHMTRIKEDTMIGLVFTGFFALGLTLIPKVRSSIDLSHILFGNLLGISSADIVQTVAISLVVAMIVTPGATACLLADRFEPMAALAILSAVITCVAGIYWSYWMDASTAGCIVLVQTLLFLLCFLLAPRHGLLAQRRRPSTAATLPPA